MLSKCKTSFNSLQKVCFILNVIESMIWNNLLDFLTIKNFSQCDNQQSNECYGINYQSFLKNCFDKTKMTFSAIIK